MAIYHFSVSGRHGFGSVTQVCFGISVSNFMCMSFGAVGRSLMIVSYVAFKMAALWFWTKFNCNPPIAHCYPILWGGGILVDHWSTISRFFLARHWIAAIHVPINLNFKRQIISGNGSVVPLRQNVITEVYLLEKKSLLHTRFLMFLYAIHAVSVLQVIALTSFQNIAFNDQVYTQFH